MQQYVILRRSGRKSPAELGEAAGRSMRVGNGDMPEDIRWIRSYVLDEGGGPVGTVCVLRGLEPRGDPQARRSRGSAVDEIIAIADTVIVRPDPEPTQAG